MLQNEMSHMLLLLYESFPAATWLTGSRGPEVLVGGAHFGFDQAAGIWKTLSFVIPWDTVEIRIYS